MARSPGHRKWPDHQVLEEHLRERLQIVIGGEIIADSTNVIRVDEDDHPPRYYLPRDDVRMDALQGAEKVSKCPFKGTATHFTARVNGMAIDDAAWSYEEPYDEHQALKERLAFYVDERSEISLRAA